MSVNFLVHSDTSTKNPAANPAVGSPKSFWRRSVAPIAGLLLLSLSALACDDSFVDPFENRQYFYTIFGYIDILETSHAVRIIPITRQSAVIVSPTRPEAYLDAEVFSTDVETGISFEWKHNLELLQNGTYGHVYRRNFVALPGRTYRLDVIRSDGITATAFTTVPYIADSVLFEISPVLFIEDSTRLEQDVHIPHIKTPWYVEAIYRWNDGLVTRRLYVPYGRAGNAAAGGGWNVTLRLSDDQQAVREHIREFMAVGDILDDTAIKLASAGLRIRLIDPDWDLPVDPYDADIYAFPETLTNVQNGYGYFGSLGAYTQEWDICAFSGPLGYEPAEAECLITR